MEIKEKLEKDRETLAKLKEKRNSIDEKIKKVEESIKYNTMLLDQKKFSEVNNVLKGKDLSIDEILKAIQSGDLLSLQEKMEQTSSTNSANDSTGDNLTDDEIEA